MMMDEDGTFNPVVPDYVIINQKMTEDKNVTLDDTSYAIVYQATVRGAPLTQVYKRIP
ncbi:MAG TPA: hypothetical protein VK436_09120 [Methanocella sp.]|nr:hypothetical protein [Methanocella sp.]